jgi:pimeloyl-ACP methyl ester carboxylesterase
MRFSRSVPLRGGSTARAVRATIALLVCFWAGLRTTGNPDDNAPTSVDDAQTIPSVVACRGIDLKRGAIIVAAILPMLCGCAFARLYATPWPTPVETFRVHTSDGWSLDLRHVAPEGAQTHPRPVVLMHGLLANGRNLDLDPQHSLARDLARRGFDVWVPSLRNVGDSEHRPLPHLRAEESDFDAYVTRDLPAILAEVRGRTGASEVDYVGHSMGGMILYAYLARGGGGIARGVTLGSPVKLHWTGKLEAFVRSMTRTASAASWVPIRAAALTSLPVQGTLDDPLQHLLMSPRNVSTQTWRELLAMSVDDVPSALAKQFAGWLERDRFDSEDRSIDYLEGLRAVHIPVMVVAGKIDAIAPPWCVRPGYDALGSSQKEWLVIGEGNGQSADYNHMDLVIGDRASKDVFAHIAEFLDSSAPGLHAGAR